jgi:SAM-dependent methyltransferase
MTQVEVRSINAAPKSPPPDFAGIKQKQQITWTSGDYSVIGTTLQIVGESLAEAVDVRAGERVLMSPRQRQCNAGRRARARRRHVDRLCAQPAGQGAKRAAEALKVKFQVADAEQLPFGDEASMCAVDVRRHVYPDHTRPAREMLRVVRSGGRIGLTNWTPDGFIGQLFKIVGATCRRPQAQVAPRCGHRTAYRRAVRRTGC